MSPTHTSHDPAIPRHDPAIHKSTGCKHSLDLRVKLVTPKTVRLDPVFVPAGLIGVARFSKWHNQPLNYVFSDKHKRSGVESPTMQQ